MNDINDTDCDRRLIQQARIADAAAVRGLAMRALNGAGVLFCFRWPIAADVFVVGDEGHVERFWYPDRMKMCGRYGYQWKGPAMKAIADHDSDRVIEAAIREFFKGFLFEDDEVPEGQMIWTRRFMR